jgi:cyclic beta-1,2-glucan synthetase
LKTRIVRASRQVRLPLYLGAILALTALASGMVLFAVDRYPGGFAPGDWRVWYFELPLVIAASALAVPLVNLLVTLVLPPRALPRMDFSRGIPDAHRTMVIVPTLLTAPQDVDDLLEAMEIRYLGNRDRNLFFALLTDFADAPEETLPEDAALVAHARAAVEALNETYREDRPCIFYLFHRPRVWNPHERVWMGYERKRGKLEQFNALLRGEALTRSPTSSATSRCSIRSSTSSPWTPTRNCRATPHARWSATLRIRSTGRVYDAARGRIVEGYAILQPRASISLTSASQSRFARLFAGDSGIDPYTREVSDVYQDLFGEGSFVGKGIYDVDAFRQAVDGRFPENLILSHDLLESGYARSALVTDVDLIEDHPASFASEASRRHRWIRGDWQLAGWLLPRVPAPPGAEGAKAKRQSNPLSALSQWKLLDNLRRSLVAPSLLAVLAGGWLLGPGPAWLWSLLVVVVMFLPPLLSAAFELIRKPEERDWLVHLILTGKAAGRPLALALLSLTFLPYDTRIAVGAILRSGVRMLFTRRGLLLWQLPAYRRRNARSSAADFFLEMWVAPVLAVALGAALAVAGAPAASWLATTPILLLWLLSPLVGWWISRPLAPAAPDLSADQRMFLRATARRTWRYFADFVGPEDNWLPPDNFQEHPAPAIASRTSPTNIGMSLLADLAAYDFGYLTAGECLQRIGNTLDSMEKLERYRGHLYNWYDTRTLQPLYPMYVSSVDSGNLAGCLLTLQAGLAELKHRPVLQPNALDGLQDTLQVLAEQLPASPAPELAKKIRLLQDSLRTLTQDAPPRTLAAAARALEQIHRIGGELVAWLPADVDIDGELAYWAQAFDRQSRALRDELGLLAPAAQAESAIPSRMELAGSSARAQVALIDELIDRCRALAAMDFGFLLAIGYDVSERRRDPSCYDLLASEARLASFLLIAQGQVPQKHWFALGRLLTSHGGDWPDVVERLDVRVPDAAAGHADLRATRCWTRPAGRWWRARSNTAASAACRGAFPSRATTPPTPTRSTSTAPSACRGWASSAGWPTIWSSRPTPRRWR